MSEERSEMKQKSTEEHMDGINNQDIVQVDQREVKKVVAEVIQSEFSGPIPPPSIIEDYERILPGSADRIIAMAEKQSKHRQKMEGIIVNSESRDSLLGIICAFLIGISCIGAAVFMVYLVPKSAGAISASVLGVTGVGSITSGFIINTRRVNLKKQNTDKNNKE